MYKQTKLTFLLIIFLLILFQKTETQAQNPETIKQFNQLVRAISGVLQNRLDIKFDKYPNFKFANLNDISHDQLFIFEAAYEGRDDINLILFNPLYSLCDVSKIIKDPSALNYPYDHEATYCNLNKIRGNIAHELGHYYIDYLKENEIPESWVPVSYAETNKKSLDFLFSSRLIQEGIGQFFGHLAGEELPYDFNEDDWVQKWTTEELLTGDINDCLIYGGGYSLVKPIIDKFSGRGIRYLLTHELKINLPDLSSVPLYRAKAIADLTKESSD